MQGSAARGLKGAAMIVLLIVGACGGGAATPTPPAPTPLSAKAIAVQPKDFAGVSLHVCPAPETGTFQTYAGAYRTGIKRQPLILTANLAAARADGWSQSLSGRVDTCKGALGFALNSSDGLGVSSYTFVFPTEADAVAAFPAVGAGTFAPQVRGSQTGFGPNSASWSSPPVSYLIAWQHKTVIALVECDNVPSCKAGAMALDSRIH
jgi:hypothetical protein